MVATTGREHRKLLLVAENASKRTKEPICFVNTWNQAPRLDLTLTIVKKHSLKLSLDF